MKGNNDDVQMFNHKVFVADSENLWCQKFCIVFNDRIRGIEMYEVEEMKLYDILPFHYFAGLYFKWNQQQSSFIAYDKSGQYCIFEQI